ncbi:MAG TPA: regulatory protein RecX, partial [Pseudonocardiaceae bacterium]|nr:regulatory protein RecX [Pseudonocardiaceae bacterium]
MNISHPARRRAEPVAAGDKDKADPVSQAKDICLRLLTMRPRTRAELHTALLKRGIETGVADQVLGRLNEVGLVDDAAFAEQWVRSRHTYQGMARRALAAELRRKGVDDPVAAAAVAAVDSESEESRARDLVRKRLRALTSADELMCEAFAHALSGCAEQIAQWWRHNPHLNRQQIVEYHMRFTWPAL